MKIIQSGKSKEPKEVTATCRGCGCKFSFAAHEAELVSDQRDGDAYVVECPECDYNNWIAATLFK
jgi:RNase P subunit RPR2